jgi:glycosyltransferase involved in cell wall biosynthesis
MLDYVSVLFSHGKEIYRQIEDFRPEIIIGFSILNANLGMRIARKNNIPFVYYLNDAVHTLVPLRSLQPIAKIIESETLKHADKVVVINEELREYAINLGADPERVSVIRAGIDSSKFNPSIDGSRIREKYGLSKDDTVLFFMGWLYMFSGLREVAHSLLEVKDKHPNIKLLVVGKGDIYKELEELRERQGLNQLVLVSWQPYEKIPDYIAASDICLLPAYNNEVMRNIVPIKMYEYMACGKPVIATKLPGLMKEFGHNGVIYVDQPTKVLEKVIELVENGRLRDHGIKAREFVKNYDWYKITDEFQDILENVVSSSRENG